MIQFAALGVGMGLGASWLYSKLRNSKIEPSMARSAIMASEPNPATDFPPESEWPHLLIDGVEYAVSPTYMAPIGIGQAKAVAEERGLILPTPRMVDAIWRMSDLKIDPIPMAHDGTTKTMDSPALAEKHRSKIDEAVDGRAFTLLGGSHKDVVIIPNGYAGNVGDKIGIYGWHKANGSVIQTPMWGHAMGWRDYSQGLRGVRRV